MAATFIKQCRMETLEKRECFSATVGLQFVGLSNTTDAKSAANNATVVAAAIKSSGAVNAEIESLPFEFAAKGKDPFANLTSLVKQTLPSIPGKLKIDVDLQWFPHTVAKGINDQKAFWDAWGKWKDPQTGKNSETKQQKAITDAFLNRVKVTDAWIRDIRTWATQNKVANKLEITLVPVLEDTVKSAAAYNNMVSAIRTQQTTDKVSNVGLRRSCMVDNYFTVVGASIELHGKWADVKGKLRAGDTWSNDGTTYTPDAFIKDEQAAVKAGVNVLYWSPAYNGTPKGAGYEYNEAQRIVSPFTGASANVEKTQLKRVLQGK